jgi:3-(3-hydroxy-phenyl)propionate hydroxylase
LVYVATHQGIPQDLLQAVDQAKSKGLPLKLLAIIQENVDVMGADKTLFDPQQRFQLRYAVPAGGAYLFRPDQHVCARWLQLDAARLLSSLQLASMQ